MSDILDITKSEYIGILKNRRKHVSFKIDDDALLKIVKYLKNRDLIHLTTIRGIVFDESSLESILDAHIHKKNQTKLVDDLHKHYHKKNQSESLVDLHRYHHKQKSKNIKKEIYRNIQKRKTNQIVGKLKRLKRLKRPNLAKKENISQNELDEIKILSDFPTKIFKRLAQLRNIETTGLNRSDLIYISMRSQNILKKRSI